MENTKYKSETKTNREKTGFICPDCNKGYLDKIDGSRGVFYGCDQYPNCRFTKSEKDYKRE